jgi:hypothetical protein
MYHFALCRYGGNDSKLMDHFSWLEIDWKSLKANYLFTARKTIHKVSATTQCVEQATTEGIDHLQDLSGIPDRSMIVLLLIAVLTLCFGVLFLSYGLLKKHRMKNVDNVEEMAVTKAPTPIDTHTGRKRTPSDAMSTISTPSRSLIFDSDKFMGQVHLQPMIIHKIKGKGRKARCMKVHESCELRLYKLYRVNGADIIPIGSGYIHLPLSELLDCFECNKSKAAERSFLLEFKTRSLQLVPPPNIDIKYLVKGFKWLAGRVREDRGFWDVWKQRHAQGLIPGTKRSSRELSDSSSPLIIRPASPAVGTPASIAASTSPSAAGAAGQLRFYRTYSWSFGKG